MISLKESRSRGHPQGPKSIDKVYRFWVHVARQHQRAPIRLWEAVDHGRTENIKKPHSSTTKRQAASATRRAACNYRRQGTRYLGVGAGFGLNKSEVIFWIDPPSKNPIFEVFENIGTTEEI